jgi:ribosomal protein L11 methyltransferase
MNDTPRQWYALEVAAIPEAVEAVEFALNSLDALGTEINNLGPGQRDILNVVGYFNEPPSEDSAAGEVASAIAIYGLDSDSAKVAGIVEVEDQDWLAEWKKHWKPTESERFVVAPTWETVETPKILIRIEPSMAFGTGTHETTRLCLQAIEENYRPGDSFFDVGTGTGILAIAVAKMNPVPVRVTGCDTDEDSVAIARENLLLNDVRDIELYAGSIEAASPESDVVCANVTLDVIVPMLPLLLAKSRRLLILSGILAEQEPAIREALGNYGIGDPEIAGMGEWIGVTVRR